MWEMAEMEAGGMAGHGMARAHFAIQAHGELITGYHVERSSYQWSVLCAHRTLCFSAGF